MSSQKDLIIQSVAVDPDGDLQITYMRKEDVKRNGVMAIHTLLVPHGDDYDDEIFTVIDAIEYLVGDVMDDWDKLETEPDPRRAAVQDTE